MTWSLRRATLTALLMVCLLGSAALGQKIFRAEKVAAPVPAVAPVPPETVPNGKDDPGEFSHAISLPKDNKLKSQIEAAVDYIKTEDWVLATEILQKLVGIREDVFAQLPRKTPDGKDTLAWTSVRAEANRLIAALPAKGMEFYKLSYGPKAGDLLKEAKATNKPELLALIMRLYLHTDAGAEATDLLGTYHLDRGNYSTASRCYSLLLGRAGADKLPPVTLFKAAYAFHQTGADEDKRAEEQVWKQLSGRVREVKLGTSEAQSVDELQSFVASVVRPNADRYANDYPLYRGNESRSAQGVGSYAFMEHRWRQSLLRSDPKTGDTIRWLKRAEEHLKRNNQPVLPSFFPVTATVARKMGGGEQMEKVPLLMYRSHWGIHAVHMKTGKLEWETPSNWSLDRMVKDTRKTQAIHNWMTFYLEQQGQQFGARPNIVFENSTVGALSTDANYVYAVEDLQVPPPSLVMNNGMDFDGRFPGGPGRFGQDVNDAVQHNRLQAFEIASGKLKWELGGRGTRSELDDCYFLGPPLPLGGKLYVLTEKQQELRLACIDPTPPGKVVSMQTLATTRDKMQADVSRRTQAAHLAYAEGILVCPTNAGAILAVDLLSNSLVWAYPYREKSDSDEWKPGMNRGGAAPGPGWVMLPDGRWHNPNANQQWRVSAPVIVDGKVIFTAPDARSLHCVNLRDGTPLWKVNRTDDDQYLAGVFSGKVVIVGRKTARGISLARGETLWTVETGLPSGQGVASENVYYLPLKEAGQTKEPEICAIDLERGQVIAHTKSRLLRPTGENPYYDAPGNLLFYEGDVISQTATEVVAYPQLKVKLAEIDEKIAKNPNDPSGLTERGVLRLDEGNLQGAIDDLSKALENKPAVETEARARGKLFETLTEYFQQDFDKAEPYLARYEDMCKVAPVGEAEADRALAQAEERRRRANFLCLVAKGREKQRKLVEAFEKYQEFGAIAGTQELVSVVDEPAVRTAPDVWSQGRIAAMVSGARPEDRKPLEDRITKRWEEIRASSNIEELKKFVVVFGSLFAVGKEARLALAERLLDDADPKSFVEAERHLSLLRGPREDRAVAARAVECLARLCTRKGLLEDAAYFYRVLGQHYPTERVRDGKTGANLYNELATDKRFLPLLDGPVSVGATGKPKLKAIEERGGFAPTNQAYVFEQQGEALPFFANRRLALQYGGPHQFKLIDRSTGELQWSQPLTMTMFGNLVYGDGRPNMQRFTYQNLGHLIVLPVGHMVFGIDPVERKVLWEKNLTATQGGNGPPQHQQLTVDPRDGSVQVLYVDGWVQRLGTPGPLGGSTLCLQTRDALVAVDPVSGRTVWTRSDVNPRSHLFGDEELLYVVEMSAEGNASSTRALRTYDGVTVPVPPFHELYQKRLRVLGNKLLVADNDPKNGLALRLYDVRTGKDLWKQAFAVNAQVLHSENANLTGAVEPDGRVRVYDLNTFKEVLDAKLADPRHLDKVTSVHLLADGKHFYVACNGPADPSIAPFGGVQTMLMPGTGLRALPVNGAVYSFHADTGKLNWWKLVANQLLVLDQFADVPMALFAARYQAWAAGPVRNVIQVSNVFAVDKRTGKLIYANENVPNGMNFHALNLDARAGKIDFIGYQLKITFLIDGEPPPPAKVGQAPAENGTSSDLRFGGRGNVLRMRGFRAAGVLAVPPQ